LRACRKTFRGDTIRIRLFAAAACIAVISALPASAIELSVTNGTDQNIDVLVDGAKLCALQPRQGRRADYCTLNVGRGRHRISVIGADGWQDSGTYGFRGAKKTCLVESQLSCCCNEDSDLF
jgi:hypothetical protein